MAMKITTKGLGEHDHAVELGKLNLITGPNGSGKTKLAEAIRIAALGYSPTFGKRPMDTAQVMRGSRLGVRLELDDGRAIEQTVNAAGKGYASDCRVSWLDDDKASSATEHRAAAMGLFGETESEIAEVLNIRSLTHATESQRAARIEALLESTFDTKRAFKSFGRYATLRLAKRETDPPRDYRTVRSSIPGYSEDGDHSEQYSVLVDAGEAIQGKLNQVGVAGAIAWAKERKSQASAETRRLRAALEVVEERLRNLPEFSAKEIGELERRREELDRAIGGVEERLVDVRRAAHRVAEAQRLIERKQGELNAATEAREKFETAAAGLEEKQARIGECDLEIKELQGKAKAQPTPRTGDLERELASIEEQIAAFEIPEAPDVEGARRALARLEAEAGGDDSPWAEVAKIGAGILQAIEGAKLAKAVREQLEEIAGKLAALASEQGATPAATEDEIEAARDCLAGLEAAQADCEAAAATLADLEEQARQLRGRIQAVRDEHALRTSQLRERVGKLMDERDGIKSAIADMSAADIRTSSAVERAEADLKAARKRLAEIRGDGNDDAEALEAQAEPLKKQLEEVRARLKVLTEAKTKRDELDRTRKELLRAEDAFTVYSASEWALAHVRADEINESGGTLTRVMREFLAAAGRNETPIIKADFLGWQADGKDPVAVKAISDGQFCLFSTALASALLIAEGAEVRPLLVEADNCDDEHVAQLLAGIEAVSHQLSVAIVSRWARPDQVPSVWTAFEFEADGSVSEAA